jgi:hypothetical protein
MPHRNPWTLLYAPRAEGPGITVRRPCGCVADPLVFGHWHPGWNKTTEVHGA